MRSSDTAECCSVNRRKNSITTDHLHHHLGLLISFFHVLDHLFYDFHPLHNILYSLGQPGTVSDKAEQACFVFSGPIYRLTDRWLRTAVFTPFPY